MPCFGVRIKSIFLFVKCVQVIVILVDQVTSGTHLKYYLQNTWKVKINGISRDTKL